LLGNETERGGGVVPKAYLKNHVLNEFLRITLPASVGLGAEIHKIIAIVVPVAHDFYLGIMKKWEHFVVIAFPPFSRKLVVEPPHTTPKNCPPVIHILPWRHPGSATKMSKLELNKARISLLDEIGKKELGTLANSSVIGT
jgi:hypothetical protein